MFTLLLISATVLIVPVFSFTNIDNDMMQRDKLPTTLYFDEIKLVSEFSHRNYTTKNGFNYDDTLCMVQVMNVMDALKRSELWAISVLDAWGKIPAGILLGNQYELGNFDECLEVNYNENNSTFIGQYCLAQVKVKLPDHLLNVLQGLETNKNNDTKSKTLALKLGICVPNTCSPEMVDILIEVLLKSLNIGNVSEVSVWPNTCSVRLEAIEYRAIDIVAICFFSAITMMMILSTIYDVWSNYFKKNRLPSALAFSIYTNGQKIFRCKKQKSEGVLDCVNGIRALSIIWINVSHSYFILAREPLINSIKMLKWIHSASSTIILCGAFAVDSFLVLSGLLVTWSILRYLDSSSGKLNLFWLYFHRYIRLTPAVVAAILLYTSFFLIFSAGPLASVYLAREAQKCNDYWWSALIYLQNYINPSHTCMSETWYLSVDMQLYVLSPLILFPLWKWKLKAIWIILALILGSIVCIFTILMVNDFASDVITNAFSSQFDIKYNELVYYPTHTRMGAWLVGVLLGYALHNLRERRVNIPKVWVAVCWCLALAILLGVFVGFYELQQLYSSDSFLTTVFYDSLCRVAWAIGMSWIIFACVCGYGGPINWFLSLGAWQPIARLSYCIYIVNEPLQKFLVSLTKVSGYFSQLNSIQQCFAHFGFTFFVALFWSLAFESPIMALENILFTKKPRKDTSVSGPHSNGKET